MALSPDGRTLDLPVIAFEAGNIRSWKLVPITTDGTGYREVTSVERPVTGLHWTSTGSIFFSSVEPSGPTKILRLSAESGVVEATNTPDRRPESVGHRSHGFANRIYQ